MEIKKDVAILNEEIAMAEKMLEKTEKKRRKIIKVIRGLKEAKESLEALNE